MKPLSSKFQDSEPMRKPDNTASTNASIDSNDSLCRLQANLVSQYGTENTAVCDLVRAYTAYLKGASN